MLLVLFLVFAEYYAKKASSDPECILSVSLGATFEKLRLSAIASFDGTSRFLSNQSFLGNAVLAHGYSWKHNHSVTHRAIMVKDSMGFPEQNQITRMLKGNNFDTLYFNTLGTAFRNRRFDRDAPFQTKFVGVATSTVVSPPNARNHQRVFLFDLQSDFKSTKKHEVFNVTGYSIAYMYPFDEAKPIYDDDGKIVGSESNDTWNGDSIRVKDYEFPPQILTRMLIREEEADKSKALIAIYDSNKSVKVMRFTWGHIGNTLVYDWKRMLVPAVIADIDSGVPFDYDDFYIIKMQQSVSIACIVVNIHDAQKEAVKVEIPEAEESIHLRDYDVLPFLFVLSVHEGRYVNSTVALELPEDDRFSGKDTYYEVSGFDVCGDLILIGGNVFKTTKKKVHIGTFFTLVNFYESHMDKFTVFDIHGIPTENEEMFVLTDVSFPPKKRNDQYEFAVLAGLLTKDPSQKLGRGIIMVVNTFTSEVVTYVITQEEYITGIKSTVKYFLRVLASTGEDVLFANIVNNKNGVTSEVWKFDCNEKQVHPVFLKVIFFCLTFGAMIVIALTCFAKLSTKFSKNLIEMIKRKIERSRMENLISDTETVPTVASDVEE